MPSIVEYPTLIQQAMEIFGDLFANEPERQHFAEYLTGLMIAEQQALLDRLANPVTRSAAILAPHPLIGTVPLGRSFQPSASPYMQIACSLP